MQETSSIDAATVSQFLSVGKIGVGIIKWFVQQRKKKAQVTIDQYLEWLRRNEHQETLNQLNNSAELLEIIKSLISSLSQHSEESANGILAQLKETDSRVSGKLDILAKEIGGLKEQVRLFDPAISLTKEVQDFEADYLRQVAREFGKIQMLGVREMRDIKQSLSVAYVALRLKATSEDDDESLRADEILTCEKLLAMRGPAGSGKSTLLSWIAYQCTQLEDHKNPWQGGVPFFVPLRRLGSKDGGEPDLRRLVSYTIDSKVWAVEPPKNWCNTVLTQKRAVLLIDGVDELPSELRPNFWAWLRTFTDNYSGNRIYVTSRFFPEDKQQAVQLWNPPPEFRSADLDEMSDEDVWEFIKNWHEAVIAHEPDLTEKAKLADARDNLPKRLGEPANRRVKELCRSPLLCALVCALHWREEGYLPSRRVELYDRCCTMLIEERDAKRDIAKPKGPLQFLDLGGKEMILQRLAWSMMRNKSTKSGKTHQIEVSRAEAITWIKPNISALDNEEARKSEPNELLDYLIERTGLLREPATGLVDFPHRTFQEYLAACAAGALNEAGDLAQRVIDDQWHETIILAAGTKVGGVPFGNNLVEELVSRGEKEDKYKGARHAYFALAVACLETGKQIREDLRNRVVTHLKEIVPPHDWNDARILSAAGDAVIPLLKYSRWGSNGVHIVSACARTLSLIGSQTAQRTLLESRGYGNDRRANVLAQICQCPGIQPLTIPRVFSMVCSKSGILPELVKPFISDLSPLAEQNTIWRVDVSGCRNIRDISAISNLTKLMFLNVGQTSISDLSPLSQLKELEVLHAYWCQGITNLSPLSGLKKLRSLTLSGCHKIEDVSPISNIPRLKILALYYLRSVKDFTSLSKLTELEDLIIADCADLTDISGSSTFVMGN